MSHGSASNDLTQRVVETYSRIDDPRLRKIVVALIRHLHTYVKEVGLKREEWETAWSLMPKMAEATGPRRNEFLLLGDLIEPFVLTDWTGNICAGLWRRFESRPGGFVRSASLS
jgi:hydroxyquinol 1,2-dioxygenase